MRNIKARYIWISVAVCFVLACVLIFAVTKTTGVWTNVVIVLIAMVFIYMTVAIQVASTKTFRYKAKPIKYPTIEYRIENLDFDVVLKRNGYKPRYTPFGAIYLKIVDINAYRVSVINNFEKYFNQEENNEQAPANPELAKCQKFIGVEIFTAYDEDVLRKLPDFSLQGKNIYYCGFYLEENKIVSLNYIEPNETFAELYSNIKADLQVQTDQSSLEEAC